MMEMKRWVALFKWQTEERRSGQSSVDCNSMGAHHCAQLLSAEQTVNISPQIGKL